MNIKLYFNHYKQGTSSVTCQKYTEIMKNKTLEEATIFFQRRYEYGNAKFLKNVVI
jgi:hypothetical protein